MIQEIREDVEESALTFIVKLKNEVFSVPIGREKDFDFRLTLTQIFVVQLSSYVSLGFFLTCFSLMLGISPHLDQVFYFRSFGNTSTILGWVCNGLFNSVWMYLFVRRSKKVLDFTITLYFVHFLISLVYSFTLPLNVYWYIVMIINLIQVYVLGKNLCFLKESSVVDIGPTAISASERRGRSLSRPAVVKPEYIPDEDTGKYKMSPRPRTRSKDDDEPLEKGGRVVSNLDDVNNHLETV